MLNSSLRNSKYNCPLIEEEKRKEKAKQIGPSSPQSKRVPNQKSANAFFKHWAEVTLQLICYRVTATNEDPQACTGAGGVQS